MGNEIRINTLEDYIHELSKLRETKTWVGSKKYLFRGHSNISFSLLPKIARYVEKCPNDMLLYEYQLVRDSRIKLPSLIDHADSATEVLAKLQHYGLPTRLLDFTENALVALYFACSDPLKANSDADGEVIALEVETDRIFSNFSPYIEILADVEIFERGDSMSISTFKESLYSKGYVPPNMEIESEEIMRWMRPYFFYSVENTERQKRQQGLFCIFPHFMDSRSVHKTILPMEKTGEHITRIVIANDKKQDLLRELNKVGIKKSFLFPEPENICDDIRSNYVEHINGAWDVTTY